MLEYIAAGGKTQCERDDEAAQRNNNRPPSGTNQTTNIGLQTNLEQQHDDADLRHKTDHFSRRQPAQHTGAEDDAGGQFTYHRWSAHAHGEFACQARGDQNPRQLNEKLSCVHGPRLRGR